MSIGMADIHKALTTFWTSASLPSQFTSYWPAGSSSRFIVFNDGEAIPGTPLPYVVYEVGQANPQTRMSAEGNQKWVIVEYPLTISVYAGVSGGTSAKTIAAALAEKIQEKLGGHPTTEPTDLTLDNGNVLNVQYQGDYGKHEDDEVYQWTTEYTIVVDVPVMV